MRTKKKQILFRVIIAVVTAILTFPVGGSPPSEARETQLRGNSQTSLPAISQNVPDSNSLSLLEIGNRNTGVTGEDRGDTPTENRSDGPSTRTVRVGIYQNPPKIFIDENGLPAGIFADLLNEIARREKWNLVYVPCEWSDCLEGLEKHRIDLMPDVAYSRERGRKYDFHETPVVDSWSQVYANSSIRVSTLSDLNGRRVAVLKKGIQEEIFEQMMNGFGFTVTFVEAKTYEEAFGLAAHGYADAVLSNHFIGDYLYVRYGLTKTPIVFNPSSLYFATAQGRNRDLLDAIERNLNEWRKQPDSYYYKTLARWSEKPPEPAVPSYLIWIIVITGGFLALSAGIILLLRAQVRAKTEYLVEANESLRTSEEKYRLLVENLNDVIFNLDAQGNITYMNPVAETIFGYRAEEIVGNSFSEYVHPEDLPGVMESRRETLGGRLHPYEFRMVDKNGSVHYVRTSSRPIERDGRHVGITGTLTDITGERRAEEALRESEVNLLMAQRIAHVGSWDWDLKTDRLVWSTEAYHIYNRDPGNYTPSVEDALTSVHPDDRKDLEKKVRACIKLNKPYEHEYRIVNPDGTVKHVHALGEMIHDEKGRPVRIRGTIQDVTDQRRAEEALRESEQKHRTILQTIEDGYFEVDLQGSFTFFNESTRRMLGYSQEEMVGLNFRDYMEKETAEKVFPTFNEVFRTGIPAKTADWRVIRKDGTTIDLETSVSLKRDDSGAPIGFFGIARDITEKKNMELQLLQTEKLSAVGTMISGVAHELNNPLTAIIGNAQLLARRDVPEDIKNRLDIILKESIRSSKIVGGLLAFAREHKPERNMISVNSILMESLKLREYDLRVSNISVPLSLSDEIPETYADPYQLQQVFINLINNARDALAGKEKGVLALRTYRKDDTLVVEFEDNGPGIPGELINKIFDPFFTTKEAGKGTGLGLSMAYGIIKEHGGTISAESKPGKGATFVVTIPVVQGAEPVADEVKAPVKISPGTWSLLVVEDEASLRGFLSDALAEAGFSVWAASTGEEAVSLVEARKFDAVISDIKMPGIGGKKMYHYIQKHHPEIADKIIFITGDILSKDTQSFLKTTKNRFIEKPFNIDDLVEMLRDILC